MIGLNLSLPQLQLFFLVFLRIGAIIATAPLFDNRSIPIVFKGGLAIAVSMILLPVVQPADVVFPSELATLMLGIAGEILLGVVIGLSVKLLFAGVQLAGQIAGFQMGFALANVMDPLTSTQVPIISQMKNQIAMLIFLSIDAHHWFLKAMVDSFRMVAPLNFHFNPSLMQQIVGLAGNMFLIAVKIAAPIMAALFLTSVALGMVSRTVPQMNIFIVAMPLKVIVGLVFLALTVPYLTSFLVELFRDLGKDMLLLLKFMS